MAGFFMQQRLLSLYRHGHWHSDNKSELGPNPVIGLVSIDDYRRFLLKHKDEDSI